MPNIRDRARDILSAVPPLGQQINSDGSTGPLFTKMTGLTHSYLVSEWAKGSKLTSCNAFTGWYSTTLGSPKYLGRFDLETYLPSIGKGDAWVKSTPDVRPKFGDICRHTKFHVGISLDFDGDFWNRADGGQGGPSAGRDVIKRIRSQETYDYSKLQGWVDIERYFGEVAQTGLPIPDWLPGWWKVMWRGQAFYYYFDRNYQVQWTLVAPKTSSQPPSGMRDTASVSIDSAIALTATWSATGSVEKFSRVGTKNEMKGMWKDLEPLTATKI